MKKRAIHIHCPACSWQPGPGSVWYCTCSHAWNTFDTGGVCPSCGHAWEKTQCLSCSQWALHREWYHELISEEAEQEAGIRRPRTG
jgi:hypothetical protein